ncbi:hypothetical protein EGW08_002055 [Elysia chlorotica]|uniref:C-type lectin domain-containing protein n=1 Tax=Elysia chlorotica TaxID=188477 RepID=A0A3S0ZZW1_ELYCH|nr:hypothetical protein EGW08_002055 [Elysia chlorotica]
MIANRLYLFPFLVAILGIATSQSQDKDVFDFLYQTSKPFGLLPTVYFLSTYNTFYTDAELACEALGGYLAEVNSPAELTFINDFIRDDASEHEFIHINGYRDSNDGDLVSSRGVDIVALINEQRTGTGTGTGFNGSPLYFDYWHRHPATVNNPPACLELDKRGNTIRMTADRCDRSINRYICEKQLA